MDSSFTDAEKRFVLAEMIKVSQIDLNGLVQFVKSYEVEPDWMSMQLPNGRNMNQCMRAAHAMGMTHLQPPLIHSIKRKSVDNLSEPLPKKLAMTPLLEPQPISPYQRLQPRPSPNPNGFGPASVPSPTVQQPSVRKRGRPSKADKEAQAQARTGSSGNYPPILAPMPPTPRDPGHPPQEAAPTPPFTYQVASSPIDQKTRKRAGRATTTDKSQPRHMPDNHLEQQVERSPAVGNLISAPTDASTPRASPAAHEASRRLTGTYTPSPAPATTMDHVRNENHKPLPPVNTRA